MITTLITVFVGTFVSTMTGLAGGILIFAVLSLLYPLHEAVALHAAIQLFSNICRLGFFYSYIKWETVGYYSMLLIPGCLLGAVCLDVFDERLLKLFLSLFLIYLVIFKLGKGNSTKEEKKGSKGLIALGFASGWLGMLIGATGPFISPFLIKKGEDKSYFIGTKAMCQAVMQAVKLCILSSIGNVTFASFSGVLPASLGCVILGTLVGKKCLPFLNEKYFLIIVKGILLCVAIRLMVS